MKNIVKSGLVVALGMFLFSCSGEKSESKSTETSKPAKAEQAHDHSSHAGHDHGHSHDGHNHDHGAHKVEAAVANDPSVVSAEAVDPENAPRFNFEEDIYDFGTVDAGDIVEHVFKFTNTGKEPLIIQNASASCGCTVPEYSKEPIAPGADGKITVKFNSKNRRGVQSKTVTITANTVPKVTKLKIKGEVNAGPDLANGPVRQ
ncbi:DUF1573 domain-containing protein [Aureibacter tunicatorum]|uniref:DUF1573 domain-containing protein n=1 Tax=Aureibacter tunicatorum TaxID=866807 RepID=A0AAE4BS91_9BACT|nr:DUF1573 domain-containing protein [Aureibacter tunicatorum]MDR6238630.1 hypothetical protein [Aureibacter tunicatorum]BDD05439.1 hypothetical protein AUTU_29220 [Aureibacter tunicatorum]